MKLKTITLIAVMVFASASTYAQSKYLGKPITISEVVTADSASKIALYDRAKALCLSLFNDPSKVIQIDDKEKGLISLKAIENYSNLSDHKYKIHYTITIAIKEGRYKYEITNLVLTGTRWSDFYSKWMDTYNDVITDADLSERFFNEQIGKKKIKPDATYIEFREKAKNLILTLSAIIKDEMLKPNAVTEQEW